MIQLREIGLQINASAEDALIAGSKPNLYLENSSAPIRKAEN